MASRLVRVNPVTVNDVLDGHVQPRPGVSGPGLPQRLSRPGAGRWAGGAVPAAPRVPGALTGVPAADRRRIPPLGGLLRRRQPHPGGAVEVHRPQHRRDAPLPGFRCPARPFASGSDRRGAGAAAGVHRPPARHRPVQAAAVLLRQEGPPGHRVLLLPLRRRLRAGVRQGLHLLPVADQGLGQRTRMGQTPSHPSGSGVHRADQRVRRLRGSRNAARDLRPARPRPDQRVLPALAGSAAAAAHPRRRPRGLLVGTVDGADRGLPHHRLRCPPACPRFLRGPAQPTTSTSAAPTPSRSSSTARSAAASAPPAANSRPSSSPAAPRSPSTPSTSTPASSNISKTGGRCGSRPSSTPPTTWAANAACTTSTTCRPRRVRSTPACCRLNVSARAVSLRIQSSSGSRTPPSPRRGGELQPYVSATLGSKPWPAPCASPCAPSPASPTGACAP